MQKLINLILLFVFFSSISAQNNIPKIIKKDVLLNSSDNKIEVVYDLIDADNDELEIRCNVFSLNASNKYTKITPQLIEGDYGFPIQPGSNKKISVYLDFGVNSGELLVVLGAYDREALDIAEILSKVDSNNLENYITQIQGKRNTTNQIHYDASRAYIQSQVEVYLPLSTLQFSSPQYNCINYEATKYGIENPSQMFVMDAHYDSAPVSPGADDNGSGVAGVLEAIRILSEYSFKKSLRFLFFDLEELGLVGSTIYASNQVDKKDSIKAVINYEMIGYYSDVPNSQAFPNGFNILFPDAYNQVNANGNRGDFITNVANTNSSSLKTSFVTNAINYVPGLKVISLEVPGTGTLVPDLRRSDHAVFWDRGIPAIMLTDGANFRNPNYHTPKDSIQYLNFNFMSQVVKAAIATIIDLAGVEHGSTTEIVIELSTAAEDIVTKDFSSYYYNQTILINSNINLKNGKFDLVNIHGNKLMANNIELNKNQMHAINCGELNPGIYYIILKNGKTVHSEKLFIHGF